MLDIKRILLTGDDGYCSVGTRALVSILKNDYELEIAGTLGQQSGVGGHMDFSSEKKWGTATVDGVPALWLDGSPADVMNVSSAYFKKPFDLILSGINLGGNISYALISSGTFSAAVRGVGVGLAPRAIVMSLNSSSGDFFRMHSENEDISSFLEYPGKIARRMFDICLENDMWGKPFVNVNYPLNATDKYRMTSVSRSISRIYTYIVDIDEKKHTISPPKDIDVEETQKEKDETLDTGAVNSGYISVSPMDFACGGEIKD